MSRETAKGELNASYGRAEKQRQLVAILERQLKNLRELRAQHAETIENSQGAIRRVDEEIAGVRRELEAYKS